MGTTLKAVQYGRQGLVRHSWRRVRKYIAVLQVSIASNLAYIAEVFFRALLLIVLVFILSQLWKTTLLFCMDRHVHSCILNSTALWP